MRNFNVEEQFNEIKKAAIDAAQKVFPVKGRNKSVVMKNIWVDDSVRSNDFEAQSNAKAKEQTYGVPIYASLELYDDITKQLLDRNQKLRLFLLPKVTDRSSYIVRGNEYQVSNQLRLKSGVYTVKKQNGELKTQVNLSKGKNFDLTFKDTSGLFYISKVAGGQANIPLFPTLVHLGVSVSMIEKAWGQQIAAANRLNEPKIEERLKLAFGVKSGSIKDYFNSTEINKDTTEIVLGKSFEKVDGQLLLEASKHLLQVHLGEKQPTDRDSLEFKELHSVEDFIKERIEKNSRSLMLRIQRNLNSPNKVKLTQIVNPATFSSVVESFFTQDDKSATPEQTNPLEMISGMYKATIMGSGGVTQEHALTDNMREIHPSHFGFIDPIHTPESGRIGANLHIPFGAVKDGKELKTVLLDVKTNKAVTLTPKEVFNKKIIIPGQSSTGMVKAMYQGQQIMIDAKQGDYKSPSPEALFSWSTNLIPFLPSNQGNRAMMASKMLEQAISLKHREAPLVQVGVSNVNSTMEQTIGKTIAATAPEDGVITKIEPNAIYVNKTRVDIYKDFALNRKSFLNHQPIVKVGDKVKKGQLLADSNYTKDGSLALGINARVAYLPYKGLNFEDGIVITESAATKLTSEHIHKKTLEIDPNTIMKIQAFKSIYPNTLTPQNLSKLDETGVIKKGQIIKHNEAVIVALRKSVDNPNVALVKKQLADRPKDISVIWTYDDEGTIIDVHKVGNKITVLIKTEEKAKIGDKLSGRMGNKGIITKIIPDEHAPRTKDGKPVEIMLNPHGVISRINIGQIYESASGKAALKNGSPIAVSNFSGEDYQKKTEALLKKTGVQDKEELIDPISGKSLGKVHVGNPYILKLFKQSTGNFSARQGGPGHAYDVNYQPVKAGGEEGSKSLDLLTMYSMLSHGARHNLRDMASVKSNQNDEFWKALKSGELLPPPKSPFVYDKFLNYLKASGIDTKKEGSKIALAPLTDKQVLESSKLEIKDPRFYTAKNLEPIKGGFLDSSKLGGFKGENWGHISLNEPVINPVFEDAVRKITGIGKKFDEVMAGKLFLTNDGKFNTEGKGVTGGRAIESILKKIDVDKELQMLTVKSQKAEGNTLDSLNKHIRYLTNLKKLELKPHEAYMRSKVPVLPPKFRPIYPMADGSMMNADSNVLYNSLGVINKTMELPVMNLLPEEDKAVIREDLYKHVKAVSGLTDINIKGRVRDGFISEIKGGSDGQPKEGMFLSKVISKKQDYVGRGTIIPEPTLGVDEVAMPEQMAWKLFEPFIIKELKGLGFTPLKAMDEIKNKTDLAKKALEAAMKDKKVLLNRAPSLHKFSIMAFKPKITEGKAIKIPPLVVSGFNADFDGDTMTLHVPVTDAANKEADKLLPSNNLFKPGTGKLMISPSQESQVGLFYLSQTEAGRKQLNSLLPKKFQINSILNKKTTSDLLTNISREMSGQDFARIVEKLKAVGEDAAFKKGFTLGMDDVKRFDNERNKIVNLVEKQVSKAKTQEELGQIAENAQKLMDGVITKNLKGTDNALFDMVESGARGSMGQIRQILAAPILVTDAKQNIVKSVIKKSYAEGLDIGDYWTSMYGARRGMMDRALQTSLPGAFSKDIMASTIDNVITKKDCGVNKGRIFPVESKDPLGRYLANNQGGFIKNTLVDSKLLNELKKKNINKIEVRSPLTCLVDKGTCAYCFGIDEHGQLPDVGENIGAKAGQTISEPLIQMTMNSFHTGGTAGSGSDAVGFQRIEQLLHLPKILVGAAALAPKDGRIDKIEKGIAGGHVIYMGTTKIHTPKDKKLKVSVGDIVTKGQMLSEGPIKPQELVKLKGMEEAQSYMADELFNAYKSQGAQLDRKMFETVVRSVGNTTRVINNPKESNFVPGDIAPYTVVQEYNKNLIKSLPVDEAVGFKLAENVGKFMKGHELLTKDAIILKASGIREVKVKKDEIIHEPTLKGVTSVPLLRKDWMAALGYRNLKKVLTEGAAQGWETDTAGYHPIPAFAKGVDFGKGQDGKY